MKTNTRNKLKGLMSSFILIGSTVSVMTYSLPAQANCNPFGCSSTNIPCNPFGCPNPGAGACTPFGCPPSPPQPPSSNNTTPSTVFVVSPDANNGNQMGNRPQNSDFQFCVNTMIQDNHSARYAIRKCKEYLK